MASFVVRNTTDGRNLEVSIKGGGPPQNASLMPGEEQSFTVDDNQQVQIREGNPTAQPR